MTDAIPILSKEQRQALALAQARRRQQQLLARGVREERALATSGALGEATEGFRGDVREFVEKQPFVDRLVLESAPSVIGTGLGAVAGAPFGPPGILGLGTLGGAAGEFIGQTTGVSPPSDTTLAITGAAPLAGRGAVALKRGIQRAIGGTVKKLPPAAAALANRAEADAIPVLQKMGRMGLEGMSGLRARPSGELYAAVQRADAPVGIGSLKKTAPAIRDLKESLAPFVDFPEGKAALRILESARKAVTKGDPLQVSDLVNIQQQIGGMIPGLQRASGKKLGAAKRLFGAISDDIDALARGTGRQRRAARIAQAATSRFRAESAAGEFSTAIANFSTPMKGQNAIQVNVSDLRKWLNRVTNPLHKSYDKNFTRGMGSGLPPIKDHLRDLEKITAVSRSPGGPGSIVVRGITAGTGAGIGAMVAGGPGAATGALLGATGPDALFAALSTPRGAALLKKAVSLGKGGLSMQQIVNISQIATQAIIRPSGQPEEQGNGS